MVLAIVFVVLFALVERKKELHKKMKCHCERFPVGQRVSRVNKKASEGDPACEYR